MKSRELLTISRDSQVPLKSDIYIYIYKSQIYIHQTAQHITGKACNMSEHSLTDAFTRSHLFSFEWTGESTLMPSSAVTCVPLPPLPDAQGPSAHAAGRTMHAQEIARPNPLILDLTFGSLLWHACSDGPPITDTRAVPSRSDLDIRKSPTWKQHPFFIHSIAANGNIGLSGQAQWLPVAVNTRNCAPKSPTVPGGHATTRVKQTSASKGPARRYFFPWYSYKGRKQHKYCGAEYCPY